LHRFDKAAECVRQTDRQMDDYMMAKTRKALHTVVRKNREEGIY